MIRSLVPFSRGQTVTLQIGGGLNKAKHHRLLHVVNHDDDTCTCDDGYRYDRVTGRCLDVTNYRAIHTPGYQPRGDGTT